MASQNTQRVRRMASPSLKQGPLKATKSFGLKTLSPSASPTQWLTDSHRKNRRSPDYSDRASPNSPSLKGMQCFVAFNIGLFDAKWLTASFV